MVIKKEGGKLQGGRMDYIRRKGKRKGWNRDVGGRNEGRKMRLSIRVRM